MQYLVPTYHLYLWFAQMLTALIVSCRLGWNGHVRDKYTRFVRFPDILLKYLKQWSLGWQPFQAAPAPSPPSASIQVS